MRNPNHPLTSTNGPKLNLPRSLGRLLVAVALLGSTISLHAQFTGPVSIAPPAAGSYSQSVGINNSTTFGAWTVTSNISGDQAGSAILNTTGQPSTVTMSATGNAGRGYYVFMTNQYPNPGFTTDSTLAWSNQTGGAVNLTFDLSFSVVQTDTGSSNGGREGSGNPGTSTLQLLKNTDLLQQFSANNTGTNHVVTLSPGDSINFKITSTGGIPVYYRANAYWDGYHTTGTLNLSGLTYAAVPEPSTYALLTGAALLVWTVIRRRKKS